jgi:hypothetical protein
VINIEIFKLFGSIFINSDEADKSLSKTEEKAEKTGGKFTKLGGMAKVAGGVIAAGAGIAASAMGGLMAKTLETTKEINKFAQVNGMSTDEFQKWDYVAKSVGYSMEQASGDMAMLAERAMDAATGAGENAEMFKKLGVSVKDSSGQLKSQEQLFNETIAGLQGMEDVTERNAIATAMLSTTGEELAPILNMTNEELENMKNNANVISEDDLSKAQEFSDKWNQAKATLGGVFTEIGIRLMPMFQTMLDWVMSNMPTIQSTMDTVFNVISSVVNVAAGIFKDHFLPILSQVWGFVKSVFIPILTELWNFFKTSLLPILVSLYTWISGHMPTIRATVETVFNKIKEVAKMVWAFFKDNILPILERFLGFVQSKMPTIQSIVERAFNVIKSVIESVWSVIENLLLPILKALWDWVSPYIPKVQAIIETAFDAIFWAVDKVVGVFESVTSAIEKAVDWLTFWDNTDPEPKTLNVTENRVASGGIASGVPRNATGTNYFTGGQTLVGERGPELVTLPRGSKISPANETRNKLKGGDTYITVNARTVDMNEKELMKTMKRMEVLYG